jgi:hypothetical protein
LWCAVGRTAIEEGREPVLDGGILARTAYRLPLA